MNSVSNSSENKKTKPNAYARDPKAQALRIDIVRSGRDMDAIASQWRRLERLAADPMSYFQSFDWCRTWCRYYASDLPISGSAETNAERASARICTVWDGDELVLVWPMMLTGARRTISKITTLTEPHSQYGNMIVDPDLRRQAEFEPLVKRCLERLIEEDKPDIVVVDSVPIDDRQTGFAGPEGTMTVAEAGASAWMDLTAFADWEDYRAALTSSTRRGRNKRRNALARLGELDTRVCFGGQPGFGDLVAAGIEYKRDWLTKTGRATRALNLPYVIEFLSELPSDGANAGAVAAAVTLDGRPIAVEIGFLWHRRFYSYLGSFDWQLRDYSPGKVQLEEALRWCIERGVTAYDLLGDPATYKSDWSNRSTPMSIFRAAPTLRGKAFVSIWSNAIRPAAKRLFEATPKGMRSRLIPLAEQQAAGAVKGLK